MTDYRRGERLQIPYRVTIEATIFGDHCIEGHDPNPANWDFGALLKAIQIAEDAEIVSSVELVEKP